jgi:hypothetical protein
MGTLGWKSGDPTSVLCTAIEKCEKAWDKDEAYNEVLFKLRQAKQELEVLSASPGRRAALRAAAPNMAGQEPSHREESYG